VHGTASTSSPLGREIYNRFAGRPPRIRSRYQFWFFQVRYSATICCPSLPPRAMRWLAALHGLDPQGKDPALAAGRPDRAQPGGACWSKMQVINSGDQSGTPASRKPPMTAPVPTRLASCSGARCFRAAARSSLASVSSARRNAAASGPAQHQSPTLVPAARVPTLSLSREYRRTSPGNPGAFRPG